MAAQSRGRNYPLQQFDITACSNNRSEERRSIVAQKKTFRMWLASRRPPGQDTRLLLHDLRRRGRRSA